MAKQAKRPIQAAMDAAIDHEIARVMRTLRIRDKSALYEEISLLFHRDEEQPCSFSMLPSIGDYAGARVSRAIRDRIEALGQIEHIDIFCRAGVTWESPDEELAGLQPLLRGALKRSLTSTEIDHIRAEVARAVERKKTKAQSAAA
jgi:hypothetical protein